MIKIHVRIGLLCFILFFLFSFSSRAEGDSLVNHNGQRLFLSGMNLAWMNFGNDLGGFNQTLFTQKIDDLVAAGGNSLRWWLHTNGRYSPQFTDGVVSGINPAEIANLELALDIAFERGVVLILCLWSFDMLQENALEANWPRNRALLEDSLKTRAYINNALIPMVDALKGHPGIAAWEIFNEPEGMINGFGWTPQKVNFIHVQRFVNMTAGAIHRTDPDAKVSNGSWNIRVLTDIGSFFNYYRDDRLIAAGGDSLGTLDFYMAHYYPQHFGASQSPFHNHASHWQLDRPLVIAEFPSLGINLTGKNLTTLEAYTYLMENGYGGSLSWTMTGHDGLGGLPESTPAMTYLKENYPDIINVNPDPDFPYPPFIEGNLEPLVIPLQEQNATYTIENLNNIFGHINPEMPFEFTIDGNSNPALSNAVVTDADSLEVVVIGNLTGYGMIQIKATDSAGKSITAPMLISVYDPQSEDKLLFRHAFASTTENSSHLPMMAVDGNSLSRWSSSYAENQWLAVELEEPKTIQRVMMQWETAYGKEYRIEISDDGENWESVYYEPLGNGGWDKIIFEPVTTKYIRMNGISRATAWGFSLFSFSAFEQAGDNTAPVFSGVFKDTLARANELYSKTIPLTLVTDPDQGERLFFDVSLVQQEGLPQWLSFDPVTRKLSGTPGVDVIGTVYAMKIKVTDMSGASDEQYFNLHVDSGTGIADIIEQEKNFSIFPNPVQSHLVVKAKQELAGPFTLRIINVKGEELKLWSLRELGTNGESFDVNFLLPGIYFLQITNSSGTESIRFSKIL
jgi:hypothetical protein